MLYAFFWVILWHLNFIYRRFGTLCLFHLHRQVLMKKYELDCAQTTNLIELNSLCNGCTQTGQSGHAHYYCCPHQLKHRNTIQFFTQIQGATNATRRLARIPTHHLSISITRSQHHEVLLLRYLRVFHQHYGTWSSTPVIYSAHSDNTSVTVQTDRQRHRNHNARKLCQN